MIIDVSVCVLRSRRPTNIAVFGRRYAPKISEPALFVDSIHSLISRLDDHRVPEELRLTSQKAVTNELTGRMSEASCPAKSFGARADESG